MAAESGTGIVRDNRRVQAGAISTIAAVAATDIAKPGLRARNGSTRTSVSTVADRIGTVAERRPRMSASSTSPPISAARRTLGDGRTSTTNAGNAVAAMAARQRRRVPAHRNVAKTAPTTIAQLAPETALRWVSPVIRNAVVRSSGI